MSLTLVACGGEDSTEIPELNTDLTDELKQDRPYSEGFRLEVDGIEEVSLISCEDGDTAVFDSLNGPIRVRFLGIDTPEASYKYDPWGYQATQFTCDKLYNASSIVVEIDEEAGPVDNYGRTLGYVWYDGRLLNLEVVEQGYSMAVGVEKLKYGEQLLLAQEHARSTNKRLHGEDDPLYDYSNEGTDMSIEDIVNNYEDYILKSVNVEGVITRKLGTHVFIEQDGYGIFVYTGYDTSAKLVVGNKVRFEEAQVMYDLRRYGGLHLTRFNVRKVSLISEGNVVESTTITLADISEDNFGTFVLLEDVEITNISDQLDSWIITVSQNNQEITIVQPKNVLEEKQYDASQFMVGQTLSIQGVIQETIDGYQLLLLDSDDVLNVE